VGHEREVVFFNKLVKRPPLRAMALVTLSAIAQPDSPASQQL